MSGDCAITVVQVKELKSTSETKRAFFIKCTNPEIVKTGPLWRAVWSAKMGKLATSLVVFNRNCQSTAKPIAVTTIPINPKRLHPRDRGMKVTERGITYGRKFSLEELLKDLREWTWFYTLATRHKTQLSSLSVHRSDIQFPLGEKWFKKPLKVWIATSGKRDSEKTLHKFVGDDALKSRPSLSFKLPGFGKGFEPTKVLRDQTSFFGVGPVFELAFAEEGGANVWMNFEIN